MYNVIVSSEAEDILTQYTIACNTDNAPDCARRLVASYEKGISLLEFSPVTRRIIVPTYGSFTAD